MLLPIKGMATMPQSDILAAVCTPSRHRFAPGDEVTLPDGSPGIIKELLPVSHYRVAKVGSSDLVAEHDFDLRATRMTHRTASLLPLPVRPVRNDARREQRDLRNPSEMRSAA